MSVFPTREEIRDFEMSKSVIAEMDKEIERLKCEVEKEKACAAEYEEQCLSINAAYENCRTALDTAEEQLAELRLKHSSVYDDYQQQCIENNRRQVALDVILATIKGGRF